ncbi:MAG TPA: sugar ABC transporter substrate-binding protein [Gemmatimonadales bacterium]|jgi:multiple sugar transport system substrate-binding protein
MRCVLGLCLACWTCGGRADGGPGALGLADRIDSGAAELQERLLTPYLARHPGLELVRRPVVVAARDVYRRELLTALAGDEPPDVFLLDDEDVPRVVDRGGALDLAPYLGRVGVDPARYDQTLVAVFRRGAGLYGLPRGYTPVVVAYNKDLLDRAAIPYPTDDWTWDDFLRVAKQLTRDTDGDGSIDQWGSAFDPRLALWLPWIWSGGGDVLCADGCRASGCLDSRATIEALRWYAGWSTSAGVAPRIHDARDAPGAIARLFASGRLGLMTTGHWAIPRLRASVAAGRLHVGFVAIPHRSGVAPATVLYVSGYAVPALTPRRKAAVELVADLTDSAAAMARAEAGMELPAVAAAARAMAADTLGWDAAFLRAAAHGRPSWGARVGPWRDVADRLTDLMDRIVITGVDPARAAGAAARELDRLLGATR